MGQGMVYMDGCTHGAGVKEGCTHGAARGEECAHGGILRWARDGVYGGMCLLRRSDVHEGMYT